MAKAIKKIFWCALSGAVLLGLDLLFINSYFTTKIEEAFYEKVTLFRDRISHARPASTKMIFINTASDLSCIRSGAGTIAVANRAHLQSLLRSIADQKTSPLAVVIDLDLTSPYSPDPKVDDSLNLVIRTLPNVLIPVSITDYKIDSPVIHAGYAAAGYTTYGTKVDKVRLFEAEPLLPSLPLQLDQLINKRHYDLRHGQLFENGSPCLNFIWPEYYIPDINESHGDQFLSFHQENILMELKNDPSVIHKDVDGRIVFIGNFSQTVPTQKETKPGVEVLADIYLTLTAHQHRLPVAWLWFTWIVLSMLSYFSWYRKLPELPILHFLFADYLADYLKKCISYGAAMTLASALSIFFFGISANLLFTSLLFSAISYWQFDDRMIAFKAWLTTKFKTQSS